MVRCSWAKEGGGRSKGQSHHKEDFDGYQIEPDVYIDEPEDSKYPDNFQGCSCCHDKEDFAGHKVETGGHNATIQLQQIKSHRPFHAPRPQQYGFWM